MKAPKAKPKSGRGGKRARSGRKPLGKEKYTLYLTPARVDATREAGHSNLSAFVDGCLVEPAPNEATG